MNCSYKGVFENDIGSVGYDNNYGFDGPYSNAYSLNSRAGRLTAGILPNIYTPNIEGPSTVSGVHASYDRLFYNNDNYDGQYGESIKTPIADANAGLAELPPAAQAELPPPSAAPEPTDLTPAEQSVITQQPIADETTGTVAVNVEPNPPETIKEQESFIYGGGRNKFTVLSKIQPKTNGVYVAPSKRVNANREKFTTEINGLRDSQYLHESFLNSKEEQEHSNAVMLVVLTVCFFIITMIIVWTTFGNCCPEQMPPKPMSSPAPKPITNQGFGFSGGNSNKNKKLTGNIF